MSFDSQSENPLKALSNGSLDHQTQHEVSSFDSVENEPKIEEVIGKSLAKAASQAPLSNMRSEDVEAQAIKANAKLIEDAQRDATLDELKWESKFRHDLRTQESIQNEIQRRVQSGITFDEALRTTFAEIGIPAPDFDRVPWTGHIVEVSELIQALKADAADIGSFSEVDVHAIPLSYRNLLAHDEHMTVTVESFHGCTVDVEVLQSRKLQDEYIREILLRKSTDQTVVQYGIVRLQLDCLDAQPREEILAGKTPLGKVLINHNVLRSVELIDLWKIEVGSRLAQLFGLNLNEVVYGRTAMIYFNGEPALELLEVVTPVQQ